MSDFEEQEISQIVEAGLEEILSGNATLQDVLLRNPAQEDDLRPELEIAMWMISNQEQVKTRPGFVRASRKRVLDRIKEESRSQAKKPALFGFAWPRRFVLQSMMTLILLVFFVLSSTGIVSASQGAIPGDQLYSVKRFSENVEYQVMAQPASRVESSSRFAGRRLDESESLLRLERVPEARYSLYEYQQAINDAVHQLSLVSDQQAARKGQLAASLKSRLDRNNEQLSQMATIAPVEFQADLEQAREVTVANVTVASEVIEHMEDLQSGATRTPGDETLVSPQSTELGPSATDLQSTDTSIPGLLVETPQPTGDGGTLMPGVTEELNPVQPSKEPRITKTPKPNPSENRPEPSKPEKPPEEPKPPKDESGQGGGGEKPPPGQDKDK